MSGEFSLAVIGDIQRALLTRGDGFLGIGGHGASACGHSLIDDQRLVAHISKGKGTFLHRRCFGEFSEIVCRLVELDFSLSKCIAH